MAMRSSLGKHISPNIYYSPIDIRGVYKGCDTPNIMVD